MALWSNYLGMLLAILQFLLSLHTIKPKNLNYMTILDWLIVALFLGTLMAIGYAFSRRNKDVEDYFVAGRSMPGWIVAIAATGTTISAGTFVGSPELGFNTDLTYILNLLGFLAVGLCPNAKGDKAGVQLGSVLHGIGNT